MLDASCMAPAQVSDHGDGLGLASVFPDAARDDFVVRDAVKIPIQRRLKVPIVPAIRLTRAIRDAAAHSRGTYQLLSEELYFGIGMGKAIESRLDHLVFRLHTRNSFPVPLFGGGFRFVAR